MSGMFASPLMVGGEILLGLSLAMFVAALDALLFVKRRFV